MTEYDVKDLEFEDEPEEDQVLEKYDIATYHGGKAAVGEFLPRHQDSIHRGTRP